MDYLTPTPQIQLTSIAFVVCFFVPSCSRPLSLTPVKRDKRDKRERTSSGPFPYSANRIIIVSILFFFFSRPCPSCSSSSTYQPHSLYNITITHTDTFSPSLSPSLSPSSLYSFLLSFTPSRPDLARNRPFFVFVFLSSLLLFPHILTNLHRRTRLRLVPGLRQAHQQRRNLLLGRVPLHRPHLLLGILIVLISLLRKLNRVILLFHDRRQRSSPSRHILLGFVLH
ncbi:hypothetical protein BKA57DRAFT_88853 [Linnemannia elongata]|nr:hypothetical protein BKA57DRAFT_88853 [Linnemannia elongata]